MSFVAIKGQLWILASVGAMASVLLGAEAICLSRMITATDELARQNQSQRLLNGRLRSEIQGLKLSQAKVSAMYVRLNDAILGPKGLEGTHGTAAMNPLHSRPPDLTSRPFAIQQLTETGVVVQPTRPSPGEAATTYEAGCSRLEFQRLVPLLAEQENSNAFLYFDRVFLRRPGSTQPFSRDPTYLDARFSIRLLSSK
jgi:hypothetical protein